MPRCHIVRQGECAASIAARYGFPSERDVFDASENQALRDVRSSALLLAPGDVVHVPDREPQRFAIGAGSEKTFKVTLPRTRLRLKLEREGSALSGEPYEVRFDGRTVTGSTDGDGMIDVPVPPHVTEVSVRLTERDEEIRVRLGHLDPLQTDEGIAGRLVNLGYLASPRASEEEVAGAIRSFRRTQGLDESGGVDQELLDALADAHGS